MKRIVLALGAMLLATPAMADGATQVYVDLWDVGDATELVDNHRVVDAVPAYENTMGIMISAATVPAGEVTFNVRNSSGNFEHEMVVGKVIDLTRPLPYPGDEMRVDEDQPGLNIGEVPELEPGSSGALTLNLQPGTYLLYCNVAGHYASGMWVVLSVV